MLIFFFYPLCCEGFKNQGAIAHLSLFLRRVKGLTEGNRHLPSSYHVASTERGPFMPWFSLAGVWLQSLCPFHKVVHHSKSTYGMAEYVG